MSETRHEAAIERLYESLHDHDLLTTPDPKWTDAGERIKGGFTHAYEAALGTCAVDHETAVYTDNSNDGMAYRGHCETCTWKGPRRGSSEGAQVDCRQHLEVAYPFREAALGAEGELGGALRRAAEGLDLAASSLRGTGSNQNAEFAEQDSREARAALAGQAEVEATPFDDDRVRHVIEAVPASAIGVGDDIMSTDLIRRVHDVKPYVAVIPGTENNGLSFDLGDRWQRYEDAEPVYRVRALPDDTSAQPARNPTCVNCRHPASVHSQDGFHACRVADCTCTELVAGDDTSAQEERAAVDKREAQGRAWDAYAATNNHDRGAALRAGFDAGVEWAEEYGESSMVKFFVDQDAAARTPQDVLESDVTGAAMGQSESVSIQPGGPISRMLDGKPVLDSDGERRPRLALDDDQAAVEVIISADSRANAEERAERIQELLYEHMPDLHAAVAVELPADRPQETER